MIKQNLTGIKQQNVNIQKKSTSPASSTNDHIENLALVKSINNSPYRVKAQGLMTWDSPLLKVKRIKHKKFWINFPQDKRFDIFSKFFIPRCNYDAACFLFESLRNKVEMEKKFSKDYNIILLGFECYESFDNLPSKKPLYDLETSTEDIGVYYITQTSPFTITEINIDGSISKRGYGSTGSKHKIKYAKKLVINWIEFDKSYYVFRKSLFNKKVKKSGNCIETLDDYFRWFSFPNSENFWKLRYEYDINNNAGDNTANSIKVFKLKTKYSMTKFAQWWKSGNKINNMLRPDLLPYKYVVLEANKENPNKYSSLGSILSSNPNRLASYNRFNRTGNDFLKLRENSDNVADNEYKNITKKIISNENINTNFLLSHKISTAINTINSSHNWNTEEYFSGETKKKDEREKNEHPSPIKVKKDFYKQNSNNNEDDNCSKKFSTIEGLSIRSYLLKAFNLLDEDYIGLPRHS
ncbi:uncharacterized protein SCDLUD_003510 [Saccharomycodes ludwigii]|uniref:uncharacterized protein n=1 Tax=Saccharomycodes ludwigii TaxID=36035 RepID=UPI001E877F8D|nr:hypothetical protein SCDLUD_003510 [Saccharomycodes ludwigii]KAH3900523.1 hypothetical protein SCDLUD_003510 [Saccharomycodes ludwigii]